jgi:hypothetical protein
MPITRSFARLVRRVNSVPRQACSSGGRCQWVTMSRSEVLSVFCMMGKSQTILVHGLMGPVGALTS